MAAGSGKGGGGPPEGGGPPDGGKGKKGKGKGVSRKPRGWLEKAAMIICKLLPLLLLPPRFFKLNLCFGLIVP